MSAACLSVPACSPNRCRATCTFCSAGRAPTSIAFRRPCLPDGPSCPMKATARSPPCGSAMSPPRSNWSLRCAPSIRTPGCGLCCSTLWTTRTPNIAPLLTGQVETRAQFEAEPTAYRWIFYRQDTTVWIRIVELRHGALHDNAGTELWSSWQPVDRLVRGKLPCGAGCTVRSTWSPRPTNSEAFTGASLVRVRS